MERPLTKTNAPAAGKRPRRPASRASQARVKAYECLEAVRKRDAFASDVIDKIIDGSRLDGPDRAFATRLVLGVVSVRGTLDAVLDMCMGSPKDVQPDVRDALRLSAYEILYLDKSPHAAVDQGVELVRHVQPKAAGVANAVLRKVVKVKPAFPFGDPASDGNAYALLHGFPAWLVERLFHDLGPQKADAFIVASNEPAPVFVGVNPIKGDAEGTLAELKRLDGGIEPVVVEGIEVADCYRLSNAKALADGRFKKLAADGRVLVSDAAAQAISQLAVEAALACAEAREGEGIDAVAADDANTAAAPEGGLSCLELCAGRGTKTVLLERALFRRTGSQFRRFVAVDNVAFKTKLLTRRARQYGLELTRSVDADLLSLEDAEVEPASFDLVFLDSPCSGLGTLRRHPEIRWRITPDVIAQDAERDRRFIEAAARYVRPGGVLVYATCTVTREENASVVRAFLQSDAGAAFSLIPVNGRPAFATYLSPGGCDGHFCAILERKVVR